MFGEVEFVLCIGDDRSDEEGHRHAAVATGKLPSKNTPYCCYVVVSIFSERRLEFFARVWVQ